MNKIDIVYIFEMLKRNNFKPSIKLNIHVSEILTVEMIELKVNNGVVLVMVVVIWCSGGARHSFVGLNLTLTLIIKKQSWPGT